MTTGENEDEKNKVCIHPVTDKTVSALCVCVRACALASLNDVKQIHTT